MLFKSNCCRKFQLPLVSLDSFAGEHFGKMLSGTKILFKRAGVEQGYPSLISFHFERVPTLLVVQKGGSCSEQVAVFVASQDVHRLVEDWSRNVNV